MAEAAFKPPARFPWLVPLLLFVGILAALVLVVFFARKAGEPESPPRAGEFNRPVLRSYLPYDVERAEGGSIKVTTGTGSQATSLDLQLPAGTPIWLLEPATAADLEPPLTFSVIAIPNEVRNYTIHLMAFADASLGAGPDEVVPGFTGVETSRDAAERAVFSGVLESFDGRNGVTRTSTGPGTLFVDPDAPIRLIRRGTPGDIEPGDRLAIHVDDSGAPIVAEGVLVLTGAAR